METEPTEKYNRSEVEQAAQGCHGPVENWGLRGLNTMGLQPPLKTDTVRTFCFFNNLAKAETSCCHSTEVQNQAEEAQLMPEFLPHLSNTKSPPQRNTANRTRGRVPHLHLPVLFGLLLRLSHSLLHLLHLQFLRQLTNSLWS